MSIERTDVPVVGLVTSNSDVFTMCIVEPSSSMLFWMGYSLSTKSDQAAQWIVFSAGMLGSGIQGNIDPDVRPVYLRYTFVEGYEDNYYLSAYSDILGENFIGYITYVYGSQLYLSSVRPSGFSYPIKLVPTSPASYPQAGLLAGVNYQFQSPITTSNNIPRSAILPAYAGEGILEGINYGFNIPQRPIPGLGSEDTYRLTYYLMSQSLSNYQVRIQPVNFYRSTNCARYSQTTGYLPSTMVLAQCLLVPETSFGQSRYCTGDNGLTSQTECSDIGFLYYYAQSNCGESYTFTDFTHQQVEVQTSLGAGCDLGTSCDWDGEMFICSTQAPATREIASPQIETSDQEISPLISPLWLGIIIGLVVIVLILIILLIAVIISNRSETLDDNCYCPSSEYSTIS